jgi:hypothetical protein
LAVAVGSRFGAHPVELQVILIAEMKGVPVRGITGIHRAPLVDDVVEVDRSKGDQDQKGCTDDA